VHVEGRTLEEVDESGGDGYGDAGVESKGVGLVVVGVVEVDDVGGEAVCGFGFRFGFGFMGGGIGE